MSDKERLRKAWLEMVAQGKITLRQASEPLGVSYRQVKRIYRRYKQENDKGLIHRSRGKESNRKNLLRGKIIAKYKEKYIGFGPTLAAEKLLEDDNLAVDHDRLRLWLTDEGLWQKQRKRNPYRQRRDRRAQFGELIQMDGSIHDWLDEGKHCCLINMVDDATGKTFAHLESGETTAGVFKILWNWIEKHGIPLALYVDLKNVYVTLKDTTYSHLELACAKLGIQIIKAYSPQAKGRVERNHAVYQDRFVKELRLKNIKTIEDANNILDGGFIDKLNNKFEKIPCNPVSAHRPLNDIDLNQVFCWEYDRQVQHDWTFQFQNIHYQIKKPYGLAIKPKSRACIRKHLDGSISAWSKNDKLAIKVIEGLSTIIEIKQPEKQFINISDKGKIKPIKPINSNWERVNREIFKAPSNPKEKFVSNTLKTSRQFRRGAK